MDTSIVDDTLAPASHTTVTASTTATDGDPVTVTATTNGGGASPWARDIALFVSLTGVIAITVSSYFAYPMHESGAMTGLIVLSNVVSYLIGIKGALATPGRA